MTAAQPQLLQQQPTLGLVAGLPAAAPQQQSITVVPTLAPAATAAAAQPTGARSTVVGPVAAGGCALQVTAGQQCGGNVSNPIYSCSMFNSCTNSAWQGACCPAAAPCAILNNSNVCWTCGGANPAWLASAKPGAPMCTQKAADGDFDYGCVLGASILFYEAQRSGALPASNRIAWRGDAHMNDVAPNGQPLVGGW